MAARGVKAPDPAYIQELASELEQRYRPQDQQIERARATREMRQDVPIDPDLRLIDTVIRSPDMAAEGFRIAAQLSLHDPKVQVTPTQETDASQRNAEAREKWSEELLKQSGKVGMGMHTHAAVVDAAVNDGGGWSKFVFSPDTWEERYRLRPAQFEDDQGFSIDPARSAAGAKSAQEKFDAATEEAKRRAGVPFKWRPVDALPLRPVFVSGGELSEVLEVTDRSRYATFRKYRLAFDAKGNIVPEELAAGVTQPGGQAAPTVRFYEHWDEEYVSYLVGGANSNGDTSLLPIKQFRHKYGRVPYFGALGLQMSHWQGGRKVGWSVTETLRVLDELESYLLTLLANVAARDVFPLLQEVLANPNQNPAAGALLTQGEDGQDDPKLKRWGMREILTPRPGYEYRLIGMPPMAEALKLHLQSIRDAKERLMSPRFSGDLGGLEGAGFAINQVLAFEAVRLGPIAKQIEAALEDMVRFSWQLVRTKVREKVWIFNGGQKNKGWIGLGPDDLTDNVNIKVELQQEQANAQLVETRLVHERIGTGTLSIDQGIERLGDSPAEVRKGIRLDQIRKSPLYQQLADQALLAELGRGDLEALTLQASQVAQTGVPAGLSPEQAAVVLGNAQPQAGVQAPPAAMGSQGIPDMGALAAGPNGAGAAPIQGSVPGQVGVAGPPQQSVVPGMQAILG